LPSRTLIDRRPSSRHDTMATRDRKDHFYAAGCPRAGDHHRL